MKDTATFIAATAAFEKLSDTILPLIKGQLTDNGACLAEATQVIKDKGMNKRRIKMAVEVGDVQMVFTTYRNTVNTQVYQKLTSLHKVLIYENTINS